MEIDKKENNDVKNKSKYFVKNLIVCLLIILPTILIIMVFVQSKSSGKLNKAEKEFFNEVTMLYNESISISYSLERDSNEYQMFISDTKEHLKLIENRIVSKNFKYKKNKSKDDFYNENAVTLSYTGLQQTKSIYYLNYNKTDNGYIGTIEESGYASATFNYVVGEEENTLTLTGGSKGYNYHMTYLLSDNLYKIYAKKDSVTNEFIVDFVNNRLRMSDKTYNFALIGTQIQLNLYGTELVSNIELISKKDSYVYQYNFLVIGNDNITYEVK